MARARPIHTLYGGAHLFSPQTFGKLARLALGFWTRWCPTAMDLPPLIGRPLDEAIARRVFLQVTDKLKTQPIEDFRIDFEDGFGPRPDAEEDQAIDVVVAALIAGQPLSPPHLGIRIRALNDVTGERAMRTLERVAEGLVARPPGERFVITLPKVESEKQVDKLARSLADLEAQLGLPEDYFALELMLETPAALLAPDGRIRLPQLVAASRERLFALHIGAYDYTALLGVAGTSQTLSHGAVELLRQVAKLLPDVRVVDGATNLLPIEPHRQPVTPKDLQENQRVVLAATRRHARHIEHALGSGIHQGWDLHPAQLSIRYATTFLYFHEALPEVGARLKRFLDEAAHATRVGAHFDDAATGLGLLAFCHAGVATGALTETDLAAVGLPAKVATASLAALLA